MSLLGQFRIGDIVVTRENTTMMVEGDRGIGQLYGREVNNTLSERLVVHVDDVVKHYRVTCTAGGLLEIRLIGSNCRF